MVAVVDILVVYTIDNARSGFFAFVTIVTIVAVIWEKPNFKYLTITLIL